MSTSSPRSFNLSNFVGPYNANMSCDCGYRALTFGFQTSKHLIRLLCKKYVHQNTTTAPNEGGAFVHFIMAYFLGYVFNKTHPDEWKELFTEIEARLEGTQIPENVAFSECLYYYNETENLFQLSCKHIDEYHENTCDKTYILIELIYLTHDRVMKRFIDRIGKKITDLTIY